MHEAEGARLGLRYAYRLFDFDPSASGCGASATDDQAAGGGLLPGLNVTHPFKERVVPHLDGYRPDAAAIGAVNTVVFDAGQAVGHNTDCWGFAESFRRGLSRPRSRRGRPSWRRRRAVWRSRERCSDLGVRRLAIFDI